MTKLIRNEEPLLARYRVQPLACLPHAVGIIKERLARGCKAGDRRPDGQPETA